MSNIYDDQIKEMQRLINYGKENTTPSKSQSIVEFHAKGADGKNYGIIRECNKFYIKVAPPKNTEVLAEDYDYIGGFNNKKENEYSTYTMASKQFDLKMKALNEAYNAKTYSSQYKPTESAEWQINETKEMRNELNRFRQLVENVNNILEGKEIIGMAHDVPEAPAKNPSDKKVNAPFTDVAVAPEDKDLKYAKNSYVNTGSPYNAGGTLTNDATQTDKKNSSDNNPKMSGNDGDTYTEKPIFGPGHELKKEDAVAATKKEGGKAVKMNENRKGRTVVINEEQVLAWSKSKDFMDKSHGTEIGSSAPFGDEVEGCADGTYCEADTEPIREDVAVHNTDNQNSPEPGVSEPGHNGDPFEEKINEEVVDPSEVEGLEGEQPQEPEIEPTDDEIEHSLDGIDLDNTEVEPDDAVEDEYEEGGLTDDDLRDDSFMTGEDPEVEFDDIDIEDGTSVNPGSMFKFRDKTFPEKESQGILSRHYGGKPGDYKFDGNKYTFDPRAPKARPQAKPVPEPEEVEEPEIDRRIDFDDTDFYESRQRRGRRVNETKLNDFGKHPAYRKEVMTLPPNKEIDRYGRDWNDDSAKGEEPFGKKIGSSAPYTDKVIDMITDAIVDKLTKKKV